MDRAARDVMTGRRDPSKIHWIGVYPVSYADGDRFGFWFSIVGTRTPADCMFATNDDSGFVFSGGLSWGWPSVGPIDHMGGRWYAYRSFCNSGA
jgi:hypothetical protein